MDLAEACYVSGGVFLIAIIISFLVATMIKSIFWVIKLRKNFIGMLKGRWKHSALAANLPEK